ncbi:MAG: hypothetical protein OXQ29_26370 [Rhodospirillaceae bacterium]|nr:hypothetical protein [Rhodospirillaceae bacterium]
MVTLNDSRLLVQPSHHPSDDVLPCCTRRAYGRGECGAPAPYIVTSQGTPGQWSAWITVCDRDLADICDLLVDAYPDDETQIYDAMERAQEAAI